MKTNPQAWRLEFEAGKTAIALAISWETLAVDRRDPAAKADWQLILECRTGRRWFVDRKARKEVECHLGPEGMAAMLARMPRARLKATGATREIRVGGRTQQARHVMFQLADATVEVFALPLPVSPLATQLAWAVLTGHRLEAADVAFGIPIEVIVRTHRDLSQPVRRLVAKSVTAVAAAEVDEDRPATATAGARRVDLGPAKKRKPRARFTLGSDTTMRRAALSGAGGPDLNWLPRQALLDRLRDLVNKVTPAFGTYSGMHSDAQPAMHLDPIDWWATIYARLTQHGRDMVDSLVGLWVLVRAIEEEPIATLTDEQRVIYDDVIREAREIAAGANPDLADGLRVLHIATNLPERFGDAGWIAIAYAATAADRSPFVFAPTSDDGGPLTEVSGKIDEVQLEYKADQLDLTIAVGARANLDMLAFRDGRLAVGISLDRITVDFRFLTWRNVTIDEDSDRDDSNSPMAGVTNALHGIAELAGEVAASVLEFNAGFGKLTIENAMVTVELAPAAPPQDPPADDPPPAIGLTATYNASESSMEATLDLWGVNPIMDLIAIVGTRVGSAFEDALGRAIGGAVKKAAENLDLAEQWPDAWHAERGPALARPLAANSTLAIVDGGARVGGWLAQRVRHQGTLPPGPIDDSKAVFSGVALTADYLAAWLRERMTAGGADPTLPLTLDVRALEQAVGDKLPRADTGPKPGSLEPAARPRSRTIMIDGRPVEIVTPVDRLLRLEILPTFSAVRSIDVVLPAGASDIAGTAHLDYFVSIQVMKYSVRAQPVSYPDLDEFGGAHGDPVAGLDQGPSKSSGATHMVEWEQRLLLCLDAQVRFAVPIVFGLKGSFANPVLPALALGVPADAPLALSFERLVVDTSLSDTPALRNYIEQVLRADAESLLRPLRDARQFPVVSKALIPIASYTDSSTNDLLVELVTLRQAGSDAGATLAFDAANGWVYWNWDWVDKFDAFFP